jgi:ADP-dependent NAD(P)H-hydrate dehydratase / NAD(P)H-hydrate epimerase
MKSQRWTTKDSKRQIVIPSELDHKYSRGTLGVITGSAQFPGAAVLTSKAAIATGLGVLRFHSSSGLAHLVLHAAPEALVQPGKVDAWLAGSGVSDKKYSDYTTWLRHRWFKLLSALITPHAGELSRLLTKRGVAVSSEAIEADPKKWSMVAAEKLSATVLLKGSTTYIAQKDFLIELPKATPWLATAGSGDVLAGIIGALLATNYIEILNDENNLARVAATGALIHNNSALLASMGSPISATSIIDFIPEAIRKILK